MFTSMKIVNKNNKKKTFRYTQEEIDRGLKVYFDAYLGEKPFSIEPVEKNPLFWMIDHYYQLFSAAGVPNDKIKEALQANMTTPENMKRTEDVLLVKYSQDPTMKLYRGLLLQCFKAGERWYGADIARQINAARARVGLEPQNAKTAVEYFNKIFQTKKAKVDKRCGYEILHAF